MDRRTGIDLSVRANIQKAKLHATNSGMLTVSRQGLSEPQSFDDVAVRGKVSSDCDGVVITLQ